MAGQRCVGQTTQVKRCRNSIQEEIPRAVGELPAQNTVRPREELDAVFAGLAPRFLCHSHKGQTNRAVERCWLEFKKLRLPKIRETGFATPPSGSIEAHVIKLAHRGTGTADAAFCRELDQHLSHSPPDSGSLAFLPHLCSRVLNAIRPELQDDSSHCIGFAPSKGHRCENKIARKYQCDSAKLIEELSLDASEEVLRKELKALAMLRLCKSKHQSQADGQASQWYRSLETHVAALSTEVQRNTDRQGRRIIRLTQNHVHEDGLLQCDICKDPKDVGDEASILSCGHRFDARCISRWLESNDSCPICRARV